MKDENRVWAANGGGMNVWLEKKQQMPTLLKWNYILHMIAKKGGEFASIAGNIGEWTPNGGEDGRRQKWRPKPKWSVGCRKATYSSRQKAEMEAEVPQDSLISLCQFLAEKLKNI